MIGVMICFEKNKMKNQYFIELVVLKTLRFLYIIGVSASDSFVITRPFKRPIVKVLAYLLRRYSEKC